MTQSEDEIVAGVTKGTLNFTLDKIKELVERFKNKDIAFIKDGYTISLVKEQKKSAEWELYKNYVNEKEQQLLIQMGLTLRKLEETDKWGELQNLRDKISLKYKHNGLHIAQFVQRGLLNKTIAQIVSRSQAIDMKETVNWLLKNVDNCAVFVQKKDDANILIRKLINRIDANSPPILILFGSGEATELMLNITRELEKNISQDYFLITEKSNNTTVTVFQKREDAC